MNGCPRPEKVRYLSRKEARLKLRRRRDKFTDGHVRAYLCVCGFFHLGRVPPDTMSGKRAA